MDHKEFFERFAQSRPINERIGYGPFTVEDLYQAIKARLIEELRTEDRIVQLHSIGGGFTQSGYRLIDTTSREEGNG